MLVIESRFGGDSAGSLLTTATSLSAVFPVVQGLKRVEFYLYLCICHFSFPYRGLSSVVSSGTIEATGVSPDSIESTGLSPDFIVATGVSPDTIPLPVGAPDTIEATARSSMTARTTGFMMIVQLSGQQTECYSGSLRRYL